MTQIQHITEKEMVRRTGVNALGYTYPKKNLILLKKGLTGKKKREVLEHEVNHLRKGEEGPFLGAAIGGGAALLGGVLGGKAQKDANQAALDAAYEQYQQGRTDLGPYREFGTDQLTDYENWLASPEGTFRPPTQEEVEASAGYDTRLGAVENSAAARGSLFSGNALRNIGEFGASEYDREYGRRQNEYQNELSKYMGNVNLGYGAAGGSAGLAQNYGQTAASLYNQRGQNQADMWGNVGGAIAGAAGAYQGRNDWNSFLDRAYPVK